MRFDPAGEALRYAARLGDAEGVRRLLAAGADVNARDNNGTTVLMRAAASSW